MGVGFKLVSGPVILNSSINVIQIYMPISVCGISRVAAYGIVVVDDWLDVSGRRWIGSWIGEWLLACG